MTFCGLRPLSRPLCRKNKTPNIGTCILEVLCRELPSFASHRQDSSRLTPPYFSGILPSVLGFILTLLFVRALPRTPRGASTTNSHGKRHNTEIAASAASQRSSACQQRHGRSHMLQHMGRRGPKPAAVLCAGDGQRWHDYMVLQQERLLPLQWPLPQPRVQQPHDAARMHRQELGRRLHQVLPGRQGYIPPSHQVMTTTN